MNTEPKYTVLGGDGKEYGPVSAEQIRKWIAEQRMEKKTPVKLPDAKDWVFLGSLPEFADAFKRIPAEKLPGSVHSQRIKLLLAFALMVAAGIILVALIKFRLH